MIDIQIRPDLHKVLIFSILIFFPLDTIFIIDIKYLHLIHMEYIPYRSVVHTLYHKSALF